MINRYALSSLAFTGLLQPACAYDVKSRVDLEPLIVKHAAANNVPAPLVHRVIIRESRYNPSAVGRGGALGLMQIKHATARGLGYMGSPAGLLDAETNLTYGVRYLAGAYRVAGGDQNQAVGFYARGYYYDAKRRGMLGVLARGRTGGAEPALVAVAAPQPAPTPPVLSLFSPPVQPETQVLVEAEAPVPARRTGGSARRKAAAVAPAITPAQAAAASEAAQPGAMQDAPAGPRRHTRPTTPLAAPAQAAALSTGAQAATLQGAETPIRRGNRSPARTAVSGAEPTATQAQAPASGTQPATLQGAAKRSVKESSAVLQDRGAETPVSRSNRSPTRTAVSGAEPTATQAQAPASGTRPATLPGAAQRSVKESSAVPDQGAETPVRRDRSPRRTAASGVDRSAQKVSAQPADPGRSP